MSKINIRSIEREVERIVTLEGSWNELVDFELELDEGERIFQIEKERHPQRMNVLIITIWIVRESAREEDQVH